MLESPRHHARVQPSQPALPVCSRTVVTRAKWTKLRQDALLQWASVTRYRFKRIRSYNYQNLMISLFPNNHKKIIPQFFLFQTPHWWVPILLLFELCYNLTHLTFHLSEITYPLNISQQKHPKSGHIVISIHHSTIIVTLTLPEYYHAINTLQAITYVH